jgi:hypothetical protein
MNKYQAYVRIKGQLVNTAVFATNPIHARLILQYQFGMESLASQPSLVTHESRGYQMIDEVISSIKAWSDNPQHFLNEIDKELARLSDILLSFSTDNESELEHSEFEIYIFPSGTTNTHGVPIFGKSF